MQIGSRSALALIALFAGDACTKETINLLTPDGSTPGSDARVADAFRPGDAPGPVDAFRPGDAPGPVDAFRPGDASEPADGPGTPDAASQCPEVVDQRLVECVSPPVSQCDAYSAGNAAQVFTPARSGAITQLRLFARAEGAVSQGVVTIADLRDDPLALFDPLYSLEDNTLATASTVMTAQFAWQVITFSSPPTVLANRPYLIHLRQPAGGAVLWGIHNDYEHAQVDPYPGGRAFGLTVQNEWYEFELSSDHRFEVRITPLSCE